MNQKTELDVPKLIVEAKCFSEQESSHWESSLFGITDGKAVGTYLEHKFQNHLLEKYQFQPGSSAKGIDFPELAVDIKVTSIKQPQSSSPFKDARQKIYGLGYSLLVFVYSKSDNERKRMAKLEILHTIFVESRRTGDFQLSSKIRSILDNEGNTDDLLALFDECFLPLEETAAEKLAEEVLNNPPELGYLTISSALQWRLQYKRVIEKAGSVDGIHKIK